MGLFDSMFGGAGVYKDMLDPEMMKQIQQQSQLAMAAQLLAAGGPSPTRTSIGQALGKGLMAGQQAQQSGVTNAAQSMLLKQKMDEYKRQTNYLAALQGQGAGAETQVPTAAPMTSGQALDLPNMQLGPTNARASMIGQTPAVPKLTEQDRLYNDLMRKSQLAAKYNMQDESSKYFDQALKVKPTPQVTGQPFEVSDLQGKPIMLQQFSDGSTQTMQGFGPRRNVSLQSFGGKMVAVDNNQLQAGQSFDMSMSPDAAASNQLGQQNLALNRSKFNYQQGQDAISNARSAFDLVNTPGGSYYVPKPGAQMGAGQMGAGQMGAGQMGAGQIGAGQIGAGQIGAGQIGAGQMGGGQVGGGQVGGGLPPAPLAAAPSTGAQTAAPTGQGNQFLRPAAAIPILGPNGQLISTQNDPEAFSKSRKQLADMRQSLGSYKDEVAKDLIVFPGSIPIPFTDSGIPLPQGADSAAMTAKYTAMTMGLKNLYELGALAGPDMALLERQMTNPASFKGWLTSYGGLDAQIQVIEDMLNRSEDNLATAYNRPIKRSVYTPPPPASPASPAPPSGKRSLQDIFKRG